MFSTHLIQYAQKKYDERLGLFGMEKDRIASRMAACTEEEQVLMKFLYGTMPLRDSGEYDFDVFLSYVNHGLFLRKTMEWCRDIPEDMFLHHILYYRINSENIEDCRSFFYEQLIDRIKGLSVREAVMEINYWCAEQAAYEASDSRTISPMTVYRSGKGRCGEESTFTVTALRSVGIPARQVYTPRWAHCDDNHAWVEAYVEGKWCFLGACEPEEVLNKGWFTNASSRALLVHTRTFCDYGEETHREACIGKEDLLVFYNDTANYALTKNYVISVVNEAGEPVEQATVLMEILNMAEYCSVVTLTTNQEGKAYLTAGLGDFHVHAMKGEVYAEGIASLKDTDELVLTLPDKENFKPLQASGWREVDIKSPVDYPMHPVRLTGEQKQKNAGRLKEAGRLREERVEGCYQKELAAPYPDEQQLLHAAKGNFCEIYEFLSKDENPWRKKLLHSLNVKDYKDARAEILEDHLSQAMEYALEESDMFEACVLCPRIYLEEMTPYRGFIKNYFDRTTFAEFTENQKAIWDYIKAEIKYYKELDYPTICSTPIGCLKLKQGNLLSRKILFVAICRTLGIPARINRVNMEAEYYDGKQFVQVSGTEEQGEEKDMGQLKLTVEEGGKWNYYQTWTIGRLQNGKFTTLDYTGMKFADNHLTLDLETGIYRIITTSRMPNGNQHAMESVFGMEKNQTAELFMTLREGDLSDMLVSNEIAEFELTDVGGNKVSVTELTKDKANILAFLEEGKEPTEHVLNEMLDNRESLNRLDAQICVVVREKDSLENSTLKKMLEAIPEIRIFYDDFTDNVETLARRMYVDPEKLPLLVVTKPGMNGIYGCSGYNVGSVDLMMKVLG